MTGLRPRPPSTAASLSTEPVATLGLVNIGALATGAPPAPRLEAERLIDGLLVVREPRGSPHTSPHTPIKG